MAIAGLLHDSVEDQSDKTSYDDLNQRFGPRVAVVVQACSDDVPPPGQPKRSWKERKQQYINRLATAPPEVLTVSRADKLHNARSIALDARTFGVAFWQRFNATKADQLWYYGELAQAFELHLPGPQTGELSRVVASMNASGDPSVDAGE